MPPLYETYRHSSAVQIPPSWRTAERDEGLVCGRGPDCSAGPSGHSTTTL